MPRRRLLLHHHQTAYEPETLELPEEVVIPKKNAPSVNGTLRQTALRVPEVTWQCSGIMVFGKKIRSLVFSTDLAIIKNINADAVIAVYPFTPQPIINEALLMASDIPVFTGVGGGLTKGHRVVNLAMYAEMQGRDGRCGQCADVRTRHLADAPGDRHPHRRNRGKPWDGLCPPH